MKKLTTTIALIFVIGSIAAQKDDTIWIKDVRHLPDSDSVISKWTDVTLATRDGLTITKPVIMLCADTSLHIDTIPEHWGYHIADTLGDGVYSGWDELISEHIQYRYLTELFWQYGYSVTSLTSSIYYLDDKKKPMPKNIFVWMSLPIYQKPKQ